MSGLDVYALSMVRVHNQGSTQSLRCFSCHSKLIFNAMTRLQTDRAPVLHVMVVAPSHYLAEQVSGVATW